MKIIILMLFLSSNLFLNINTAEQSKKIALSEVNYKFATQKELVDFQHKLISGDQEFDIYTFQAIDSLILSTFYKEPSNIKNEIINFTQKKASKELQNVIKIDCITKDSNSNNFEQRIIDSIKFCFSTKGKAENFKEKLMKEFEIIWSINNAILTIYLQEELTLNAFVVKLIKIINISKIKQTFIYYRNNDSEYYFKREELLNSKK